MSCQDSLGEIFKGDTCLREHAIAARLHTLGVVGQLGLFRTRRGSSLALTIRAGALLTTEERSHKLVLISCHREPLRWGLLRSLLPSHTWRSRREKKGTLPANSGCGPRVTRGQIISTDECWGARAG